MDTTRYYAVMQAGGPCYGLGASEAEAIADARRSIEPEIDEEGAIHDPLENIGRNARIEGEMYLAQITEGLYRELDREPSATYHRCATGLLDAGRQDDCPLCGDASYPDERDDTRDRALATLDSERRELQERIYHIDIERKRIAQETKAAEDRAAAAWRRTLDDIQYAWNTHSIHVANNIPLADRERLTEPTPVNVLETARRRGYAPDWMEPAHMLRAMREIKRAWKR